MADNNTAAADEETLQSARRQHGPHDSALADSDVDHVAVKDDMLRLKVRELEEANEDLAQKAFAASQRFADYENDIRVLQQRLKDQNERHNAQQHSNPGSPNAQADKPGLSRLGSFMRKPAVPPPTNGPSAREQELETLYIKEQTARIEAEKKTKEMTAEIEDLSATLFQQANDMVATERRENAALRGRIQELERASTPVEDDSHKEMEKLRQRVRVLEQRDKERQRRLEKLEAAHRRIDRVRSMLAPG